MKVLRISPEHPDRELILLAAKALREDRILVYPTDTVYGLGCAIDSERVREIYEIKRREKDAPLSIACSDLAMVKDYAELSAKAEKIISENINKPYTFVVRKKSSVPDVVTSGMRTVGLRIPDHPVTKEIIAIAEKPIITTSANISGDDAPAGFDEITHAILSAADIAIDSGRCKVGRPSTVIDLECGRIIR